MNEVSRSLLNTARENLARRFGACCRRGSAEGFVNPVLDKLGRLTELRSESASVATLPLVRTKHDLLFESGSEAFRLHKSVVESLGVRHFDELFIIVEEVIDDIEANRSADIDGMNEVTSFLQHLGEVTQAYDFNEADAHIIGSGAMFYKAYLQTVLLNDNYWLSDIELLCLCACRRQSVVILKHMVGAASFINHESLIFDGFCGSFH